MKVHACPLCATRVRSQSTYRVNGLNVCDSCVQNPESRLAHPNEWLTIYRGSEVSAVDSHAGELEWVTLELRAPRTLGLSLEARSRSALNMLRNLFRPSQETGDPLFDRRVQVCSETPGLFRRLLRHQGTQNLLMELVANGGEVRLDRDGIRARCHVSAEVSRDELFLDLLCLMYFARGQEPLVDRSDESIDFSSAPSTLQMRAFVLEEQEKARS